MYGKVEQFTPVATPHRVATYGPCDLRQKHDTHLIDTGVDNAGNLMFWDCPGQYSDCSNCDDRKCMDCVLRIWHDYCEDTCPMCC